MRTLVFETPWQHLHDGWCTAARGYARAMAMAGLDVHLKAWDTDEPAPLNAAVAAEIPPSMRGELPDVWDANLFSTPLGSPEAHGRAGTFHGFRERRAFEVMRRRVHPEFRPHPQFLYTMFERRNVQPELVAELNLFDGVFVPCSANLRVLEAAGCGNATWVPYPYFDDDPHLKLPPPRREPRVFLWAGRWEPRKAPHNLVRAFFRAFKPGEANLILKLGPSPWATEAQLLRGDRGNYLRAADTVLANLGGRWTRAAAVEAVRIVEGKLTAEEMLSLHAAADVYVSASRGEGIELGAFAAKLSGRRVVTTDSGGPLDFLGEDDVVVPSTGDASAPDYAWLWGEGSTYADYDVDALAAAMQSAMRSTREVWERTRVPSCHRAEVVGGMLRTWMEERVA